MTSAKSGVHGYAFLVLMMMVTILLISLTAALPSIYAEGQREKEEELIFRGNQYGRAILFFHRQFGRFPSSIKELVKKTNGMRFLRHEFSDPMTSSGKWRFIHANAAGMVIDSKTQPLLGGPGSGTNPQNLNNSQSNQGPQSTSGFSLGQNPLGPATSTTPGNSSTTGTSTTPDSSSSTGKEGASSAFSNQMSGAFIVGVASTSKKSSFRVYNNHTKYDEWEFLGIDQLANAIGGAGGPGTTPGQNSSTTSPPPGQNSGKGTNPNPPATPPPTPPTNPPDDNQ